MLVRINIQVEIAQDRGSNFKLGRFSLTIKTFVMGEENKGLSINLMLRRCVFKRLIVLASLLISELISVSASGQSSTQSPLPIGPEGARKVQIEEKHIATPQDR